MVKICHDRCSYFKCKKIIKPIYNNHRRCKICEVYYEKDIIKCPCCSCITRSRPYSSKNNEKYNNNTIRIDDIETLHLYSTMLRT